MTVARLRLLGCGVLLAFAGAWLLDLDLAAGAPRVDDPHDLPTWYEHVGAAAAAASALRLVALGLVTWLLLAVALQLLATAPGLRRIRHIADAVSPALVRRIGGGLVSLSVTAGLVSPSPYDQPPNDQPSSVVAVMQLVDLDQTVEDESPPPAPPAEPVVMAAPAPLAPDVVPVRPGDSLWSIAEDALSVVGGPPPTEGDVARYWIQLIDLNRAALVDPSNPDLIYPGHVVQLPSR